MSKSNGKTKTVEEPARDTALESRIARVLQNSSAISRAMLSNRLGTQFGGERDLYATFGYIYNPQYQDYKNLYDRQGLATRIVEKIASDAWNKPPIIVDGDARSDNLDEKSTPFLKQWVELSEKLQIYQIFRQAEIMLGFSRYAVIFIGAPGENFSDPAGSGGPFYISAFDESQATFSSYIKDMKSEKFGMPEMYNIAFNSVDVGIELPGGQSVHYSRVLHVSKDRLGSRIYGRPGLQSVINRLFDWEKVTGAGAEVTWLTAWKGMLFAAREGAELPVSESEEDKAIIASIDAFMHRQQRYGFVTDVDVHDLGGQTVSIKDVCDVLISEIAGSKGYPKRMLLGNEAGELASTQDKNEYNGVVDSHRTNVSEPEILRPFIDWNIRNKNIAPPASGKFSILWREVYPMTQKEKADYAAVVASAASSVTGGVPEEALDINEFRAMVDLPPRTEQQMQEMEDEKIEEEERKLELEKSKQPVVMGKPGDDEKGFSQNILVRALNKLGIMNSFPGHKGRPGERGGSLPRSAGGVTNIESISNEFRNKDVEHVAVFMGDRMTSKGKGHADSVAPSGSLKGSTIVHNHPDNSSFSRDDIIFAAQNDVSKMVVVTKEWTYTMELPDGVDPQNIADTWNSNVDDVTKSIRSKNLDKQTAVRRFQNMMWSRVADKTGMTYTVDRYESVKQQHLGPGDHPSGSPQSVHGKGGAGKAIPKGSAEAITKLLDDKPDGFSYRPMSKSAPTSGYMSSVSDGPVFSPDLPTEEKIIKVQEFLDEKKSLLGTPDIYVGGWHNPEDNMFYLDASKNYSDIGETMLDASKTKQKSIFDVTGGDDGNGDVIWVSDWLEQNPSFEVPAGTREYYTENPR